MSKDLDFRQSSAGGEGVNLVIPETPATVSYTSPTLAQDLAVVLSDLELINLTDGP